ncbi:hypothetical protein [Streptomonospora wellingtoniae]|uniref:HEPN domain-containing protein n=1 Tax=Streptomonospora wellingtoniae TaxID=3075544 RepID=A0ABU2KPV6_9ACTN|nr:hypothetical protein [Streptomonospora sp. DSM 45055]MDT0301293.1 hypothetical protein [Streptomonospora sp. DSM 45055]
MAEPPNDPRITEIARKSKNFGHLLEHEPELVLLGAQAESYVHSDPNVAMYKARLFAEVLTKRLVDILGLTPDGPNQTHRINALRGRFVG